MILCYITFPSSMISAISPTALLSRTASYASLSVALLISRSLRASIEGGQTKM